MTPIRKRAPRIAAALRTFGLVTIVGAMAAAGASAAADESKPVPRPVTRKVTIDATSYQPPVVVVKAGDTVVWTNNDLIKHTVTAAGGAFDSKDILPGGAWSYTVKKAGVFDYACTYHVTMRGTLRVQ